MYSIHCLLTQLTHTHTPTHPLTHPPTHSLTHSSLTHSLTHSPTHSLTHSLKSLHSLDWACSGCVTYRMSSSTVKRFWQTESIKQLSPSAQVAIRSVKLSNNCSSGSLWELCRSTRNKELSLVTIAKLAWEIGHNCIGFELSGLMSIFHLSEYFPSSFLFLFVFSEQLNVKGVTVLTVVLHYQSLVPLHC